MGGSEFSQLLTADVMGVLANGATRPVVRKKAALCLLRLIRKAPPDAEIMQVGRAAPPLSSPALPCHCGAARGRQVSPSCLHRGGRGMLSRQGPLGVLLRASPGAPPGVLLGAACQLPLRLRAADVAVPWRPGRFAPTAPPAACLPPQPEVWGVKLATMLEDRDLGVLLGLTTLLLGVVSRSYEGEGRLMDQCQLSPALARLPCSAKPALCLPACLPAAPTQPSPATPPPPQPPPPDPTHPPTPPPGPGYEACVPRIVQVLERLKQRDVTQDYTYYGLASPWLQARGGALAPSTRSCAQRHSVGLQAGRQAGTHLSCLAWRLPPAGQVPACAAVLPAARGAVCAPHAGGGGEAHPGG